jgi:hypothetical protein
VAFFGLPSDWVPTENHWRSEGYPEFTRGNGAPDRGLFPFTCAKGTLSSNVINDLAGGGFIGKGHKWSTVWSTAAPGVNSGGTFGDLDVSQRHS